jgi:plastocyanin
MLIRHRIGLCGQCGLTALAALAGGRPAFAQSLLERPPNLSGAWTPAPGVVQFNFVHRFSRGPGPERKITSFPTFVLAAGLPGRTTAGVTYATNSTLVARYPNEWEFFGRIAALSQERGSPVDAGVQVAWDLAARGLGGELSLARREGRVRVLGVARLLHGLADGDAVDVALGGGAAIRLTSHVSVAGDVVTLADRDADAEEQVAWSAGLQLAIPGSPHTLSLHAANVTSTTLQGASRGSPGTRFGFEFTVPVTLARYFGRRAVPPDAAARAIAGDSARVVARDLAFRPASIEIAAGTTVEWANEDPLAHSVTSPDGAFDSGLIESGRSWRRTFTTPGTYRYTCTPHPFMRGVIVVRAR